MNRAPDLAPPWLPRQRRRHINRALHKLFQRNACSVCGSPFKHNSRTASGLDAHGTVVLTGECCLDWVARIFGFGFYSARQYDFLVPARPAPAGAELTPEQIAEGIALYQKVIADTDKRLDDIERRGGIDTPVTPVLSEHPWKSDDRDWFAQNPKRSHRLRQPFPGEADEEAAETEAGHALIILVRQVEPGARTRALVSIPTDLLPVPDSEAAVHALFEAALGHEPMPCDRQALCNLIEKYAGFAA
jgi:hypothetical protein